MYLEHFGLSRFPFSIAPDPDFLYPTSGHQEALAHLNYALHGASGLICLTGEVGTGKTTVCRSFISSVPDDVHVAYIFNPQLSPVELLQSLCDELRIAYPSDASLKVLYQRLNHRLLELYGRGDRVICVIDEAQSMPAPLLEQVRLLTNLETNSAKLLTVILVGQPELNEVLARHELRQLNQRISARFHLNLLSKAEVSHYIQHRLKRVGANAEIFTPAAVNALWKASGGVPRLLNTLCDRALLGAYAQSLHQVDSALVRGAVREVLPAAGNAAQASRPVSAVLLRKPLYLAWLTPVILVAALWLSNGLPANMRAWIPGAWFADVVAQDPVALLLAHQSSEAEDCAGLAGTGEQCLWVEWPLKAIQQASLPAVVEVRSRASQEHRWRLLAKLDSNSEVYTGRALLLWSVPAGYTGLVRPGESSAVIRWVRQRLGQQATSGWQVIAPAGQRQPTTDVNELYDPLLARQVMVFQQQHGLAPDRIIGPRTLIAMQAMVSNNHAGVL